MDNKITLKDIELKEFTLDNLDGVREAREEMMTEPVHICVERAYYITEFMKQFSDEEIESKPILFRARAINEYLINKKPVITKNSLLAGTTGAFLKSAPVYPEFIGLTIWSELETISNREKNPQLLTQKDADTLNFNIYPYWIDRDVLASTKKINGDIMPVRLLEKMIFYVSGKAGCISHTVPLFDEILEKGMEYIINKCEEKAKMKDESEEFYEAVSLVLKGVLQYADNLSKKAQELAEKESDLQQKSKLQKLASICANVPKRGAVSFHEAVNSIWICLIAIHAENMNMAISPGRLDQILYPFLKKDMDEGTLTLKEAMEIISSLWIKIGDNVDLVPQVSEELFGGAGTAPAVTVGGIDKNYNDAVNDLTYIMLRVTELLMMREPNMNARYYAGINSLEYRNRVSHVIASTKAVPAFYNDIENIKTLKNQGVSDQDATDYAVIGCVELACAGKSYDSSSSIIMNLTAALEMTLYNGKRYITGDLQFGPKTGEPSELKSFDDVERAFKSQCTWLIEQAVDLNEKMGKVHQMKLPTPLLSALFFGPVEQGKDLIFGGAKYNASGATNVGFADVADSLNAIKKAVFEDEICTFEELVMAVRKNFKGEEKLLAYLRTKPLKYGTDEEREQGFSKELIHFLYETYQSHTNYRGGKYRPAYWTMTNHSGQGKITHALPNGRKANMPFASGITPVSGNKASLTECLQNVASLNSLYIPGGEALNIKFEVLSSSQDEDVKRLGDFVECYFNSGGQQVQFNIMSYEMLKDAKAHPDKYPDLLVRVSGYSAYFNDLNDAMKDELITRTEYDIKNGRMVENHA